ncbi:ankyrin repeat domain-containing protein [Dyadobacter fermentans]|uniref:Ankyrin n=1 Tax=Dyadobacter fermentans (strain ATCC 700827 / DSM 18053 / CIP 107007 / KCTC 52180 / NS114) TaxID=471854 RepID=C6VXG2_DYAFD|nr:ankyrin repeat domain-containing protein [Dyadobacter fermentans]ACT93305.1 Ankyrin [Dyadobacter fermentans DSM 18053]
MNTTDLTPLTSDPTPEYYEKQAAALADSCRSIHTDSLKLIREYHPDPEKITLLNRPDTNFGLDDARAVVAREHGFEDWPAFLQHISDVRDISSPVSRFERAADAVVQGDTGTLKSLLAANPALVHGRSARGHKATLLHYTGANGVENFRQLTPANALEVADILLSAGAEPDALADTYGNKWGTTLDLLVSSSHPAQAGVQTALAEKLLDYGAAVNGVRNDGAPLLTAIYFYYPDSAEVLVKRGARVDNVVTAAAMGETAQLAGYLDDTGKLRSDAPLVQVEWLKIAPTPEANLALAFVWAAMLNRVETVRYLLEKGVSPASKDHRDWTALHWAGYLAHLEMADMLIAHKAPLEARNEFGGTVLDQTLWGTAHEGLRPHHLEVVQKLVDAGAKIHTWWLLTDLHPPLHESVARILQEKV